MIMARLESTSKAGFYPTPPIEMEYLLKRLSVVSGNQVTLLDPCCGKGEALKQWKEYVLSIGGQALSYGIELEKSRAAEAKKQTDYVENCGYEECRMSYDAFSAMYLNPPFDNGNGERLEVTFLRDLTENYLQAGGVLIFNLPQYVLRDCAKLLASRFTNIKVYRFTDENYDTYKQIIVYAVRRRKGIRSEADRLYQQKMEKELFNLSFLGKDAVPTLDAADWHEVQYVIPRNNKDVQLFQSMKVEPEDILQSLQQGSFFAKVESKITDLSITSGRKISPATTLKTTHVATAIASGALPEEMGDHLLVGVTKRIAEKRTQMDVKSGKELEVTTLKPKSIVRVFSEKGIFDLK